MVPPMHNKHTDNGSWELRHQRPLKYSHKTIAITMIFTKLRRKKEWKSIDDLETYLWAVRFIFCMFQRFSDIGIHVVKCCLILTSFENVAVIWMKMHKIKSWNFYKTFTCSSTVQSHKSIKRGKILIIHSKRQLKLESL